MSVTVDSIAPTYAEWVRLRQRASVNDRAFQGLRFHTSKGLCTQYALACGYKDVWRCGQWETRLWWDEPCYHVCVHHDIIRVRATNAWRSFDSLGDARKWFVIAASVVALSL